MTTQPKWSTSNRKAQLVKLFLDSGGFCALGYSPCKGKWQTGSKVVCAYGTPCNNPQVKCACRFKCLTDDGIPIRQCKVLTLEFRFWRCGHNPELACYAPFDCHYERVANRLVKEWQAEDRVQANLDWKAEVKAMHSLGERRLPIRGKFSNIATDIFFERQPLFYLESLGMSGLKLQPFAKVKLSSSYMRLYVDLGDSLKAISKNKRRKAIRYAKPLPQEVAVKVSKLVSLAVRDYLSR